MVNSTISQEMEARGIEPRFFDIFYARLKEEKRLPQEDIIPSRQYTTIIDYLRERKVLGQDNNPHERMLILFERLRTIENTPPLSRYDVYNGGRDAFSYRKYDKRL